MIASGAEGVAGSYGQCCSDRGLFARENAHGHESVDCDYQTGAGAEAVSVSAIRETERGRMAGERGL